MHEKTEKKIIDFIEGFQLIEKGDKILVAVSGGPDSVFLLHILNLFTKRFGIKLSGCHINHNLRGENSNADERFVKALCVEMDIPLTVQNEDVPSFRKEKNLSLEDAARRLRLSAIWDIAATEHCTKIALGHTFDDNIETFFLNLFRGSGREGLLGISRRRGIVIRPLLSISKKEILSYLKEKEIDYRIDVSNWETLYRRNFIRRELVPLIEKRLDKDVKNNISHLIEILSCEEEMISEIVEGEKKKSEGKSGGSLLMNRILFRKQKVAVQRRLIIEAFEDVAGKEMHLNYREVESLRKAIDGSSSGLRFSFAKVIFFLSSDTILVKKEKVFSSFEQQEIEIPFKVKFRNRWIIEASILESLDGDITEPSCAYFDLDEIHPPLLLRTKCNGDRFIPFGMNGEKKVKDYFVDSKIPFWNRNEIPIISDKQSILWIVGLRRSNKAKITESTKRVLKIEKREIDL